MAQVRVARLDHVGVIVAVMHDCGRMDMSDTRLVPDTPDMMTPGEAVAGMILKGVGVAHRPLSLTPHFFASPPLDLLVRAGLEAALLHRLTRGRTRDDAYADGGDRLWQALALRYHEAKASSLPGMGCITRLPHTLVVVSPGLRPALEWDPWPPC